MIRHHLRRWPSYTWHVTISSLVTPLTRQTLSADVYGQLRDLLMNGQVKPGEQLSLRSMAEALHVSVMPVREAVQRLVAEQALELSSTRVLRVPVMTVSQFLEITSIRINLESLATARTAATMDEQGYAEVLALHERFSHEMSLKRPDGSKLVAANKELHFAVYRRAGMPMLMQMVESLWLRVGPVINYDFQKGSTRVAERVASNHHGKLVAALKKKDAAAATKALSADIQGAADFIVSAGVLVASDTGDASHERWKTAPSSPLPGSRSRAGSKRP